MSRICSFDLRASLSNDCGVCGVLVKLNTIAHPRVKTGFFSTQMFHNEK